MHACTHACMYVCLYACMPGCLSVCLYVCLSVGHSVTLSITLFYKFVKLTIVHLSEAYLTLGSCFHKKIHLGQLTYTSDSIHKPLLPINGTAGVHHDGLFSLNCLLPIWLWFLQKCWIQILWKWNASSALIWKETYLGVFLPTGWSENTISPGRFFANKLGFLAASQVNILAKNPLLYSSMFIYYISCLPAE